ncbi:hypothetical protein EIM48_07440 [Pseudoxanthomonas sp. SGNA-20]|uniref:hypothetical protein n=1 Tax=Pseudoxanthomonas sp. SGNA-20 TaxID=2493088 RepID=UPI000F6393D4|nr:hypothetical protein [Pseudoxanthomonas sp. SGNA-20]RRN56363.1 hypothetical protein EIM48_07440 [Pseudoxanthomonas sp. SGNA-20]
MNQQVLRSGLRGGAELLLVLFFVVVGYAAWRKGLFPASANGYLGGYLQAALAAAAGALLVNLVAARSGRPGGAALVLGFLAVLGVAYYCGLSALAAAALLLAVSWGVGSLFHTGSGSDPWLTSLVGLAVVAAVVGWLLPFQVHDGRIHLAAAVLLVAWRREAVLEQARAVAAGFGQLRRQHPWWSSLLAGVAGFASIALWLPSLNYDDNAAHLGMVGQLLEGGYYRLDVSSQVWAVAPWANNVLHSLAALLAGQESRASMGLLWLLLGISGAYRLALALDGRREVALAAAAVFASHPLTVYFGSTMQVDGCVAAVVLHLAALLAGRCDLSRGALAIGALFGLLAGLKASNVVYALPALAWIGWQALRHRQWWGLARLVVAASVVGGSSYFYALLVTGNPVFPLFNSIFQSPYMPPVDFLDARWRAGIDASLLWDLTFHSPRFGEHAPGAAGLAFLVLLPGCIYAMSCSRAACAVGLWALASGLLLFAQLQYLRYVFPALALLGTVGVVGAAGCLRRAGFAAGIPLLAAANLALVPTTIWIFKENPWQALLLEGRGARTQLVAEMIPQRALIERYLARDPDTCVLNSDTSAPFVAGGKGRAHSMAWYDQRLKLAKEWADEDPSGERWREVLRATGTSGIVVPAEASPGQRAAMQALGYVPVDRERGVELWSLPGNRQGECRLGAVRDQARRILQRNNR